MNKEQKLAIKNFFEAAKVLKDSNVIRSSSYVGNIAEFICANLFEITLSGSQREEGLDGVDLEERRIEIKYHNGEKGNNILVGKYKENQNFEDLIVILGPSSKLRVEELDKELFEVYRINDFKYKEGTNIAKRNLQGKLKYLLNSNLDIIKEC